MENCKADNTAEKRFRSYQKQGQLSLGKKHLYQGLSISSCSVDVSTIKNALLKLQIHSKIPTVGAVPVFSLELFRSFIFYKFFYFQKKCTYFQELLFSGTPENAFYFLLIIIFIIIIIIFIIIIILTAMFKQESNPFVSICSFEKSDALYFFLPADYF